MTAAAKQKFAVPSDPHLDLRVLGQFLVVVETLNMTVAAQRMGMSTPAVSQIVLRLERDLGVTLFERNPHGLRLTPAGVLLRDRARKLAACEAKTIHDLAGYNGQHLPKLRVCMVDTIAVYLVNAIVAELSPLVGELEVQTGHTVAFVRDFLRDEVELIISNEPLADIPELERHRLCRQGLVALIPSAIPGSRRSLGELAAALPIVRFQLGGRLDSVVNEYLRAQGVGQTRHVECGSPAAMAQIIQGGQGWAIAPPLAMAWLQPRMPAVEWVALAPPTAQLDSYLVGGEGRFLDLPKSLAERCRAALRLEVAAWRGSPLEPCRNAISIEPAG